MIGRLCVAGLGLMGGSLAMAARRRGAAGEIVGFARREETRRRALELGVLDAAFDTPAAAVRGADLTVFCMPVMTVPAMVEACDGAWAPGAVVTDVGSTKAWLTREMKRILDGSPAVFVGSHPLAGSEETGIDAAREDLYERAMTIVTSEPDDEPSAVAAVCSFWESIGARVARRAPDEHDRIVARTSHLPHLTAAVLTARVLGGSEGAEAGPFCAGGFRDMTRIAEGDEGMWHDIVKTNRAALLVELEAFGEKLDGLAKALRDEDYEAVRRLLSAGRALRRQWRKEHL